MFFILQDNFANRLFICSCYKHQSGIELRSLYKQVRDISQNPGTISPYFAEPPDDSEGQKYWERTVHSLSQQQASSAPTALDDLDATAAARLISIFQAVHSYRQIQQQQRSDDNNTNTVHNIYLNIDFAAKEIKQKSEEIVNTQTIFARYDFRS